MIKLMLGKMEEQLRLLDDNSVDSIVTDPPYGIDFMGKKWDYQVPSVEQWKEALRVLKPGGHLISFSSARTYHRMAVLVEDAGFEIRDQIMWVYGSGFPKSRNLGKAYDKKYGIEREITGSKTSPIMNGSQTTSLGGAIDRGTFTHYDTAGTGPLEGWGTQLKPSHEPMVLARKPLSEKSVLDNAEKWGVGGLNIDATRVPNEGEEITYHSVGETGNFAGREGKETVSDKDYHTRNDGRWPANFIHDGSQGVLDLFPDVKGGNWATTDGCRAFNNNGKPTKAVAGKSDKSVGSAARFFYVPKVSKKDRNEGLDPNASELMKVGGTDVNSKAKRDEEMGFQSNNANVLFEAKAKALREAGILANTHPTVKPTDLMHYLIRMVTPEGGTVLDPFMGSGSTGKAAVRHGYEFIGIEMEEHSYDVAKARIEFEQ